MHTSLRLSVDTHRLVAQSDDVRDRASAAVLHHNPQVCVLEVAAIVFHHIGAGEETQHGVVIKGEDIEQK